MSYYVYQYVDPANMEKIYIGKGQGERDVYHWNSREDKKRHPFRSRLRKMAAYGLKPIIERIWRQDDSFETDDLAEEFAFLVEEEAIEKYGRRVDNTGTLWNLTKGGEGCKLDGKALAKRNKAIARSQKGKVLSEETKRRVSEAKKKLYAENPELRRAASLASLGRKQPPEEIERRRKALIGKTAPSPEGRKRISIFMKLNNPMHRPEVIEKMRLSKIGKKASAETKLKMSLAQKGKIHPIIRCPHCGKEGGLTGMKSWHFDNCKYIRSN